MRKFWKPAALAAFVGLALFATWVRLPYYALGPGPAREVEPLIHVSGAPVYQSGGKFVMTTVSFEPATALVALLAWVDPHRYVVGRNELFPPHETPQQEQRRSLSEMDTSKLDAASVVLERLSRYPRDHAVGALIESVVPACPAEGRLYAGDQVLSIDGTAVRSRAQAVRLLDAGPQGAPVTIRVRAGGQTHDVTVTRRKCGGAARPLVGITLIPSFPYSIRIESDDVGGPSAGLMWALGLYDLLTPGDLTRGRIIAGTGTIDLKGTVGPIGGVGDKVVAAERAGAAVFLCPKQDLKAAQAASDGTLDIVSVASFQDALDTLRGSISSP